jgi:hypothetical protein
MDRRGILTYDPSVDQWGANLRGRWYRVRCGEQLGIKIGSTIVGCRLELDTHWYVELPDDSRFILHPRSVYTVAIDA